jgi:hypothetical protein
MSRAAYATGSDKSAPSAIGPRPQVPAFGSPARASPAAAAAAEKSTSSQPSSLSPRLTKAAPSPLTINSQATAAAAAPSGDLSAPSAPDSPKVFRAMIPADSPGRGPIVNPTTKAQIRKSLKPSPADFAKLEGTFGLSTTPSMEAQKILEIKYKTMPIGTEVYAASRRRLQHVHNLSIIEDNANHISLRGNAATTADEHSEAIVKTRDEWKKVDRKR